MKIQDQNQKIQSRFLYDGFGFPVELINVPMVRVRGTWTLDVNFNTLSARLIEALASRQSRLTGAQVRFIRHSLSMTLTLFARRFCVTHPAVIKWEAFNNKPTNMSWQMEKDIRLEALRSIAHVDPVKFFHAYQGYATLPKKIAPGRLRLEV